MSSISTDLAVKMKMREIASVTTTKGAARCSTRTVVIVGPCGLLAPWLRVVVAVLDLDFPSPLTRHNAERGVCIVHDVLVLRRLLSTQTSPVTLC